MRIENASPETIKVMQTIGKVMFWMFTTSFAFALAAALIEIIKTNPII